VEGEVAAKKCIGPIVKQYATMIHSLKSKKIKFVFRHDQRIKASIDCSNFITNEFCLNPSLNGLTTKATPVAWYIFAV
jgi:hypothetical protein